MTTSDFFVTSPHDKVVTVVSKKNASDFFETTVTNQKLSQKIGTLIYYSVESENPGIEMNDTELSLIDFKNFNFNDKEQLSLIFHNIENLCSNIESKKKYSTNESIIHLEEYVFSLIKLIALECNLIKEKKFEAIKRIQFEINSLDNTVRNLITSSREETVSKWMNFIKSSDAFYVVTENYPNQWALTKNKNEFFENILWNVKKSIKLERMVRYHDYIVSGQASNEFEQNGFNDLKKQIDSPKKSEIQNIFTLAIQVDEDKFKVIEVLQNKNIEQIDLFFHPVFFPSYSPVDTIYNKKETFQEGISFFKNFDVDFNEMDLSRLNILPYMELVYLFKIPENKNLKIIDLIKINPIIYGDNNLQNYFKSIHQYKEPEQAEKLLEFLSEYLLKVTKKISFIKSSFHLDKVTQQILIRVKNIITGIIYNFNCSNLPDNIPNKKIIDEIMQCIENYNFILSKINEDEDYLSILSSFELKLIMERDDLIKFFQKRNKLIS